MLILEPICHETIWGGHRFKNYCQDSKKKIGHLYSLYCREGVSNGILNGKWKGMFLNEVFQQFKCKFGMEQYLFFPLTLALVDAKEDLSIQVHPDDEQTAILEGREKGKRESWYFIDAPKEGFIYCGCKCNTIKELAQAAENGRCLDAVEKLEVEAGDYVFVKPGMLHAMSAGSFVYEIEEGSDLTYRIYDFDRVDENGHKRALHREKALSCVKPVWKPQAIKYPKSNRIKEATYTTEIVQNVEIFTNNMETLVCFTVAIGETSAEGIQIKSGMTVLLWPGEYIQTKHIKLAFAAWIE